MTVRLTSIVHILAGLPGLIALILSALGIAPFTVYPWIPWALFLLSGACVYLANWIPNIFEVPGKPAPVASMPPVPDVASPSPALPAAMPPASEVPAP